MSDTFRLAVVGRIKHGVLYEAIKKRGWTNGQAAEFLHISQTQFSRMINMKRRPPFLFSGAWSAKYKKKIRIFTEKLMELTGQTVEDLFPKEFMTDEFLSRSKVLDGIRDVPKHVLLGSGLVPKALPAPDEIIIQREMEEELVRAVDELEPRFRHAVQECCFEGRTFQSLADERGVTNTAIAATVRQGIRKVRRKIDNRRAAEALLIPG